MSTRTPPAAPDSRSWSLSDWPENVFPHTTARAKYLVRAQRDSLILAGALVRVGRELVVMDRPYARWLQRQGSRVPGFVCAANRETPPKAA